MKLSDLTLAGWLLTLATIIVMVSLLILFGGVWNDLLPQGEYPAILLALPGLVAAVVFFIIGALVLRAIGLPISKSRSKPSPEAQGAGTAKEPPQA